MDEPVTDPLSLNFYVHWLLRTDPHAARMMGPLTEAQSILMCEQLKGDPNCVVLYRHQGYGAVQAYKGTVNGESPLA